MFEVIFVVVAAAVAAWIVLELLTRRRHGREAAEVWRRLAADLGGTFVEGDDQGGDSSMELRVAADGVGVTVSLVWVGFGRTKLLCTDVQALTDSGQLILELHRDGGLSPLPATIFGMTTVKPDARAFARAFLVKANDEALARQWLDGPLCQALLGAPSYSFLVKDQAARALLRGHERDGERLRRAIAAVAALARGSRSFAEAVEATARELGGEARWLEAKESLGGLVHQVSLGVDLLVDLVRQEVGVLEPRSILWTRLRAEPRSKLRPFVVVSRAAPKDAVDLEGLTALQLVEAPLAGRFVLHASPGGTVDEALPPSRARLVDLCEPAVIAFDGQEVTILVEGVLADRARLGALLRLGADLAQPGTVAPYRG